MERLKVEESIGLCAACGRNVYPSSRSEVSKEVKHRGCQSGFPLELFE